ncbi:hypothetical protein SMC26_14380 [Actinomadura fulvescens]|uniref:hypothetical protein n=1 Tax=Actinomadura fulvescens TaxID=46160 RepID=UPI0031DE8C6F
MTLGIRQSTPIAASDHQWALVEGRYPGRKTRLVAANEIVVGHGVNFLPINVIRI